MVYDPAAFDGLGQNVSTHCDTVTQSWGWDFNWTLRDGAQTIEQHQYMIFRYLTVEWLGDDAPPTDWTVTAWGVNAPFDPEETSFSSSDPVLNRVWDLAANMLLRGVLDTYTDSNARERRPYEADGLVTAGNRMLLQTNNVMWARHSHSWIFSYPTWPVEWLLITPMLAYMVCWTWAWFGPGIASGRCATWPTACHDVHSLRYSLVLVLPRAHRCAMCDSFHGRFPPSGLLANGLGRPGGRLL